MISAVGSTMLGAVWGWLLAGFPPRRVVVAAALVETLLIVVETGLVAGWHAAPAALIGAGAAWLTRLGWHRRLRERFPDQIQPPEETL